MTANFQLIYLPDASRPLPKGQSSLGMWKLFNYFCAKRSLRSDWQFGPLQILSFFSFFSSFAENNHFLRGGSEGVDRPGAPWWFDAWFWSCSRNDTSINRLAIGASIIRSPLFERFFWTFFEICEKNENREPSGRLGNLWRATTSHWNLVFCWNERWPFQRVYWSQILKCRRNPIKMNFITNVDCLD